MKRFVILACAAVALILRAPAQEETLRAVSALERSGAFTEAAKMLSDRLAAERSPALRTTWLFEMDRLRRVRLDYSVNREKLWSQLQRSVRDVTREEFDRWIDEGRFDRRVIDGEEWFVYTSRSNLFWRYADAAARRLNARSDSVFEHAVLANARAITGAADTENRPYVLPKRFSVTMNVSIDPKGIPTGRTVRAWLPIPRSFPFQKDFRLVRSSRPAAIDQGSSPIRSAYLERVFENDSTFDFEIEYEYTHFGIKFPYAPELVEPYDPSDPIVQNYTREGPHVVFTDTMRSTAASIADGMTNPLEKARAYYDWIAENIQYSYAIEYSTIRNISDYCLMNRYGDCGQEALLFITLCRMSGIPARWQSGWFTFPGGKTNHDWTEIYVRPWGWIPVDPYMGIFSRQYLTTLGTEEQQTVQDFYFGGLDQYRIAANSDHSQTLRPPKRGLRSDDVDFQRGELEYEDTNIYFDAMSYKVSVKELPNSH